MRQINQFWKLTDQYELELCLEGYEYFVDLEDIKTRADIMDWVFHVASKQWADEQPYLLNQLVDAFNKLLRPREAFWRAEPLSREQIKHAIDTSLKGL